MTNDVKLGLVLGLGLVLTVAVTYYTKDAPAAGDSGATAGSVRGLVPPERVQGGGERAQR